MMKLAKTKLPSIYVANPKIMSPKHMAHEMRESPKYEMKEHMHMKKCKMFK